LDADGGEVAFTNAPALLMQVGYPFFGSDPVNGEDNRVYFLTFPRWSRRYNNALISQMLLFDGESPGLPCIAFVDMTADDGEIPWDLSTYTFIFTGSSTILSGAVS
jgi:hypothetical protein